MKYNLKPLIICVALISTQLISGCKIIPPEQKKQPQSVGDFEFELSPFKDSNFKQVEATFFTHQSKELVFRVLSNIEQTSQWLERVESLEVLTAYNNQQYLLRTVINSPWPFKNRELITCVNTHFEEKKTTINISSCSDRVPENTQYVRLSDVESSWTIRKISNSLVEINYKTWIDPSGNVPAFIFNSELIDSTESDLLKLQAIIDNASMDQFSY
ncbi:hypothetical protein GCM10007916_05810 [Psychromonas marina]|uniref:START domain-containing protein n=1 Tax=Psychromonas marina TaxID=88364 RepID=A0ABQ6DWX5_9GAMM|nr:SRPBCC family protein [Psychromonas marina]GLS89514.1 hypothetical protein GCM10007916_05810 [Psychromonas marina]